MLKTGGRFRFLLLIILVIFAVAPSAEALLPLGTEISFSNSMALNQTLSTSGISSYSFTHFFDNNDFWPVLEDNEELNIQGASLILFESRIKPTTRMTVKAYMEGSLIGEQILTRKKNYQVWEIELPEDDLETLQDKEAMFTVEIAKGKGSLTLANSTLGGIGVVVPEPASMALVLGGLALIGVKSRKN